MASSKLATRHAAPPALVAASLAQIEAAIGGRAPLVAALAYAPKSRDLDYLVGLIGDPEHTALPLADLCAMGGITAGELLDAYKSGELNRAQAVGTVTIGQQLPHVIADTFARALPSEGVCSTCAGLGTTCADPSKKQPNPEPQQCGACKGTGRLMYAGDIEHKKLALDMGKMVSKGGPAVAIQMNQHLGVSFGTAGGALEKLQAATDKLLYSDEPVSVVEAEVVEEAVAGGGGEAELDDYTEDHL